MPLRLTGKSNPSLRGFGRPPKTSSTERSHSFTSAAKLFTLRILCGHHYNNGLLASSVDRYPLEKRPWKNRFRTFRMFFHGLFSKGDRKSTRLNSSHTVIAYD